ncbi:sensor histidine kinase [Cryptosporangium arvum]|uniref:ATP-binding protein n=1 Tax=Cryptosporangium arvum TaxID=80871 RepID=UPI0004B7E34E|nr:ATP-binding protein [Cryptosporangium arvum]
MYDSSSAHRDAPADAVPGDAPTFSEARRPDTPSPRDAPAREASPHPPGGVHEATSTPGGLRARLWWTVVLALVVVALIGAGAAVVAAALEPSIWVAVGAAGGWLLVLLGALLGVNAAVRPIGAQLAAERAARATAERAAWEAQWRDNTNRTAMEEHQRGTAAAVAQVNAALAESVRELVRVADAIRDGQAPDAEPPAVSAEGWPASLVELRTGVQDVLHASFGVATLTASHQPVGVLITLARRLQPLIHRAIKELDALENQVEDPDMLNALFQLDHLVTRARRQAESIAVLGGATARQIRKPVPVYTVLRQAIAEIEHYGRVKVLRPVQGMVTGHAVTEVIHLIAELIENATVFSPPDSRVQVQVDLVPDGLSIEIDDLGLVMPADVRQRMNQLLTSPERLDVGEQLKDGRIGLIVVAAIARRYQIRVRLERNERGGNRALVVLPAKLLAEEPLRRPDLGPSALPAAPVAVAAAPEAVAAASSPVRHAPADYAPSGPASTGSASSGPTSSAPEEFPPAPGRYPAAPASPAPAGSASGGSWLSPFVPTGTHPVETPAPRPDRDDTGGIGLTEADRQRLAELGRAAFGDPDRARPGASRGTASVNPPGDRGPDPSRPPLPRRDGQHMAPELRGNPERAEGPEPGAHNPGLFASYQRGRERADTEEPPNGN